MGAFLRGRWIGDACLLLAVLLLTDYLLDRAFYSPRIPLAERLISPVPRAGQAPTTLTSAVRNPRGVETHPSVPPSRTRLESHAAAAAELAELSLFADGVGMNSTPAVSFSSFEFSDNTGWKGFPAREVRRLTMGLYSDGASDVTGFLDRTQDGVRIVVTGCATCHFGRVLGRNVPGLGNKNIDPAGLGQWIERLDWLAWLPLPIDRSAAARRLQEQGLRMARGLHTPGISNETQGLVPVAQTARWLYESAGEPLPAGMTPAAAKVPHLWGYAEKLQVGLFCDGMGDGEHAAWAAVVELAAGNTVANIRAHQERILAAERSFGDLLPPTYPLVIDWDRAAAGRAIFAEHCQSCHGEYRRDAAGLAIFQSPQRCSAEEISTDPDRADLVTPEFASAVRRGPVSDIIRLHPQYQKGYLAPRLEGVWARFPYLHNGSVPNIADLLTDPAERSEAFDLAHAGEQHRFDEQALGLTTAAKSSPEYRRLLAGANHGVRSIYLTTRLGHSNAGHAFGIELPANDKRSLIEYLKTL